MILSLITFTGCFLFPLTLTGKVLSKMTDFERGKEEGQINLGQLIDHFRFLLHYWICFASITYFESVLAIQLILNLGGLLGTTMTIMSTMFKLWLFYGHGCLIINKCYIARIGASLLGSPTFSFTKLEQIWIDPVSMIILSRKNILLRALLGICSAVFPIYIINSIHSFVSRMPYNTSFLDYSLREICYMDTTQDLHTQYNETIAFIGGLVSSMATTPNVKEKSYQQSQQNHQLQQQQYGRNRPKTRSFSDPECEPVVWKTRGRSISCNDPKNIPFAPPQGFRVKQIYPGSRISSPVSSLGDSQRSIPSNNELLHPMPVLDGVMNPETNSRPSKLFTINRDFFQRNKHKFSLPPTILNPTAVRFVRANTAPYPAYDV